MVRQLRELAARELQEVADLLVDVGTAGFWGQFFACQQLGDIGFRNLRSRRQVSLLEPQFFQPLFDR